VKTAGRDFFYGMAASVPHHLHARPTPAEESAENAFLAAQRAPAQALWEQRAAAAALSQRLFQAHDKAGAKAASNEAHALEAQARAADAASAAAIFSHKQERLAPCEIDLHGLHVEEAKRFLAERLEADARSRAPQLVVIYGQGHHSADHKAHVKPAVLELLRARGLAVREGWHGGEGRANEGVCTVALEAGAGDGDGAGAATPAESPSFDAGLRIKLPVAPLRREVERPAAKSAASDEGGCCCAIM
jgi:DNA-nicking Smr family endonuclease